MSEKEQRNQRIDRKSDEVDINDQAIARLKADIAERQSRRPTPGLEGTKKAIEEGNIKVGLNEVELFKEEIQKRRELGRKLADELAALTKGKPGSSN